MNLYGYCLAAFADMEQEPHSIRFPFEVQDISREELRVTLTLYNGYMKSVIRVN